jgi:hypothetical protein
MTYSEPTPEQEIAGQDAAEQETAEQEPAEQETAEQEPAGQDAAGQSEEPGKNQGDPLFAETEDDQPDAGAGTAPSATA